MPDLDQPIGAPMAITIPDVPPTAIQQQLKGQLRIFVSALMGALVLRHFLPAWAVNNATVDYVVGVAGLAGMAGWQWTRAKIIHSRFWALATNQRVPNDIIKPAASA